MAERDGWFVAVEKAIAEAKEAKEGIESSEAYKEEKTKLGKSNDGYELLRRDASRVAFPLAIRETHYSVLT